MKKYENISLIIYNDLANELNRIYSEYTSSKCIKPKNECILIDSKLNSNTYRNVVWLNDVGNTTILRINIEGPILSMRGKFLYDDEHSHAVINLLDFAIKDLCLRSGGFATKVLNILPYITNLWMKNVKPEINIGVPIKILIFRFFSIPFQIKNGFKFRFILDQLEEFTFIYGIFKIIMVMNQLLPIGDIEQLKEFTFSEENLSILFSNQILEYYNHNYRENIQMKERFLEDIWKSRFKLMGNDEINFYTNLMYKNICNTFANDFLSTKSIITYLWENFYLEKRLGESIDANKGSIESDPSQRGVLFLT